MPYVRKTEGTPTIGANEAAVILEFLRLGHSFTQASRVFPRSTFAISRLACRNGLPHRRPGNLTTAEVIALPYIDREAWASRHAAARKSDEVPRPLHVRKIGRNPRYRISNAERTLLLQFLRAGHSPAQGERLFLRKAETLRQLARDFGIPLRKRGRPELGNVPTIDDKKAKQWRDLQLQAQARDGVAHGTAA